jgi:lipid II:glycine glycyltransferase (peptidoglycan interpeptide bridge formation enzyme)
MRRDNAHEKYFFPNEFFHSAFRSLENSLYFWKIRYRGEIIAGVLVLHYGNLAYTWLSGAMEEFYSLFPNNFLIYQTILQLKREPIDYLILGGGKASGEDSLFAFKAGFSPFRKDFYIYKKIHLPVEYQKLIKMSGMTSSDTGYFPLYRILSKTG